MLKCNDFSEELLALMIDVSPELRKYSLNILREFPWEKSHRNYNRRKEIGPNPSHTVLAESLMEIFQEKREIVINLCHIKPE